MYTFVNKRFLYKLPIAKIYFLLLTVLNNRNAVVILT